MYVYIYIYMYMDTYISTYTYTALIIKYNTSMDKNSYCNIHAFDP